MLKIYNPSETAAFKILHVNVVSEMLMLSIPEGLDCEWSAITPVIREMKRSAAYFSLFGFEPLLSVFSKMKASTGNITAVGLEREANMKNTKARIVERRFGFVIENSQNMLARMVKKDQSISFRDAIHTTASARIG